MILLMEGTTEATQTLGQKLADAGLNTLVCIAVVFTVLIFISFIISLFRFIPKAEAAIAKRKADKAAAKTSTVDAIDNTISQIAAKEEEELVDDLELVAVITAAIAASQMTTTDGFVVRSIRKVKRQ